MHGRTVLDKKTALAIYPALQMRSQEVNKRFMPNETLFATPEVALYADLVQHLESSADLKTDKPVGESELKCNLEITYKHLYQVRAARRRGAPPKRVADATARRAAARQDVRAAVDWCHQQGLLKKKTLEAVEKFVARNPARLRSARFRVSICERVPTR